MGEKTSVMLTLMPFSASAFVAGGAPAYVYRFSYVPAALRERLTNGVPHGFEIPFVFNTLGAGPGGKGERCLDQLRPEG